MAEIRAGGQYSSGISQVFKNIKIVWTNMKGSTSWKENGMVFAEKLLVSP